MKKVMQFFYKHTKFALAFVIAFILFMTAVYAGDVIFKAGDLNVTGSTVVQEDLEITGTATMNNITKNESYSSWDEDGDIGNWV